MIKAIQIAYDEHFELKCKLASDAGFDGIAVNFHDMTDRSDKAWEEAPERILSILKTNNLKPVQSHLPYYDLRISAEELDEEMEKAMLKSIETSGKIGCPWCVYHPRSAVNNGFSSKKALEINQKVISGYIECADKYSTGIALENLPIFRFYPIMSFYTSDWSDLLELTMSFNTESAGICWDVGHANLLHLNQAEAIEAFGNKLKCTHIHNNFSDNDDHLPPDQGNVDWKKVIGAMKKIGYKGPLTLETHCRYHDEALLASFAKHNLECLKFIIREAGNK